VSIVVRQKGEEWMIDLNRVMVWLMFSRRDLLTVTIMGVLLLAGGGVFASRELISESSASSVSGSVDE